MKRRKKIFRLIILTIFLLIIVLLFINKTTIKLFNRCIEYYNLKTDLKILNTENTNYKETLYQLENNPEYIQKIAKAELELIGDGEIVYIFEEEKEDKKNEDAN